MDQSRVLSIGWPCFSFKDTDLLDTTYFPEFDTIILFPRNLLPRLLDRQSFAQMHTITRAEQRFGDLDKWVREGHALIVITAPLVPIPQEGHTFPLIWNELRHSML
jgi:hypothetical protein